MTGKYLCQSLFFNKIADWGVQIYFKKWLWYSCFPVNFKKFLRAPFLQNIFGQLLLKIIMSLHFRLTFETKKFIHVFIHICERRVFFFVSAGYNVASIYLFKVNSRNTRKRCEICLTFAIKTQDRRQWRRKTRTYKERNRLPAHKLT